ncbi:MAG: 50S ribosomal protein L18 [Candidatus Woesearchaeota archaeon]|nr:50S ribosomal protein L18 [Candidatus Woesearchaeota archaeon]
MAHKKIFTALLRRKRLGKTDYKKRLALLKSQSLRLVVRRSNKHMLVQLVEYADSGDKVLKTVSTRQLAEYGWDKNTGNISAAYLAGLLIGVQEKGKEAILDIGLQSPITGSRIFAVLKGAVDGGLKINCSDKVFPSEERIKGKHMNAEAVFEKTKKKIMG